MTKLLWTALDVVPLIHNCLIGIEQIILNDAGFCDNEVI